MKKILLLLLCAMLVPAQAYGLSFGRNKMIVDRHKWHVAGTEHFEIYHYEESSHLIPKVSRMLEDAYERVTRILRCEPDRKSPLFLYFTHNHFEQNNIADAGEGTGGFAEPLKYRFVLPITGSDRELEHVITHEFTHIVCFYIWYANTWKSVSLLKSVFYPLWVVEGIAEYTSGDNDDLSYASMVMRDAVISDLLISLPDLQNFGHLSSYQIYLAYKESESAIRFMADKYGEESIAEMVALYRESIDINSVLLRATKQILPGLNKEWMRFVTKKYEDESSGREDPDAYSDKLTKDSQFNTNPVFSPDGKRIAFISDCKGYNDIFIMNADGSGKYSLLNGKVGTRMDNILRSGHAISFSPDGRKIVFVGEKSKKTYLCILDVKSRRTKKIKIPLYDISSPCFSNDGRKIVFAGMGKSGANDLYLINSDGNGGIARLTDDEFDDDYPVFSPDDSRVLFVSEHSKQKDLYMIDVAGLGMEQVTDTPCYEIQPAFSPDGNEIYFVSDPDGIYNIYRMKVSRDAAVAEKLTDVKTGVFMPSLSPEGERMVFVSYRNGEQNVHLAELPGLVAKKEESFKKTYEKLPAPGETGGESLVTGVKPYRLKASSDILYPLAYYSTAYGLWAAAYWMGSDMMGDHNTSFLFEYTPNDEYLSCDFSYLYSGMRPQIGFNYKAKEGYIAENVHKTIRGIALMMRYPFSASTRLDIIYGAYPAVEKNTLTQLSTEERYDSASASFVIDTAKGKMLDVMSGWRTNLSLEQGIQGYEYLSGIFEAQKYVTLYNSKMHNYHVFALRFVGADMIGKDGWRYLDDIRQGVYTDEHSFSLGGPTSLRGYVPEAFSGTKLALFNAELRIMLLPEMNYHMWYFWPDLYFKNLQMVLFFDAGRTWGGADVVRGIEGFKADAGVGFRLNVFLLAEFPLVLRMDWAWQLDNMGKPQFNLAIGPTF